MLPKDFEIKRFDLGNEDYIKINYYTADEITQKSYEFSFNQIILRTQWQIRQTEFIKI